MLSFRKIVRAVSAIFKDGPTEYGPTDTGEKLLERSQRYLKTDQQNTDQQTQVIT